MGESTSIVEKLRGKLGLNALKLQHTADGIPTCWIQRQNAHDALRYLKNEVDQPYRMLYDLTAIDERTRVHRERQPASDFTIIYHLLSFDRNEYFRVKVPLNQGQPPIDTATDLWPAANWYEREVWDMFGIRFQGHPQLERILMPKTSVGHPLLKDYAFRPGEEGLFRLPPDKDKIAQKAQRLRSYEGGTAATRYGTNFRTFNIGPKNAGLEIALQVEGDEILNAVPVIGFHHRGAEKMAERQSWQTFIPYTDRINDLGGVMDDMAYLVALEKLAGIEVPPRAEVIRVMLAEMSRMVNHLVWCGTFARDLGEPTTVSYTVDDRENAIGLIQSIYGARRRRDWLRIGGVAKDLRDGWNTSVRDFVRYLLTRLTEYDKELMRNRTFKARTQGVGACTKKQAIEWGVTGPNLRACGFDWDFRKKQPYSGYDQFEFDIPTGRHGDCYDRGTVRVEEMRQSLRIIEQCVNHMPDGPYHTAQSWRGSHIGERTLRDTESGAADCGSRGWRPKIPPGEALGAIEAAEGSSGYYLVSDGGGMSYRTRMRTPSFAHMQMLPRLARGRRVPDLLTILGAMDIVPADVDR